MATVASRLPRTHAVAESRPLNIPWYLVAVLFGATSIIIGLQWDISWHKSIGRDTFWSPPHMAIYLGGVVAGLSAAFVIFKTTFAGTAEERAAGVSVWGFRGPLGAYFTSWGAVAMVVSAPLDDWWHDTYGLDVKILSPPHALLAFGIFAIQLGAIVTALALQNQGERDLVEGDEQGLRRQKWLRRMFIYAAGLLLTNASVLVLEFTTRGLMHSSIFYQVTCLLVPIALIKLQRAAKVPFPATKVAAIYTLSILLLVWILPLFPAEPKLGPVLNPVTSLSPPQFPLLYILPALAIDLLYRRFNDKVGDWTLAVLAGLTFFAVLLPTQWFFGNFLMTPYARNWFFAAHYFPYFFSEDAPARQFRFYNYDKTTVALVRGLGIAIALAIASSRVGLWWGDWMRKVQR